MHMQTRAMQFTVSLLSITLLLLLSACNLAGSSGAPTATPTATAPTNSTPDSLPQVEILAPEDNTTVQVDTLVQVDVRATDADGINRVQLLANGDIVRTSLSDNPGGDALLERTLSYTPRTTGNVILEVIAFRGSVISEPAELTIQVVANDDAGSAEGDGGGFSPIPITPQPPTNPTPNIPNDGICRAQTSTNLNYRAAPFILPNNVIEVIPAKTLVQVIAQLPSRTWWKIVYGGNVGWISAQFTTLYGSSCNTLPVENPPFPTFTPTWTPPFIPPTATATHTPTPPPTPTPLNTVTPTMPPLPDLLITSVTGPMQISLLTGTTIEEDYNVGITNNAAGDAGPFRVVYTVNSGTPTELTTVSGLQADTSVNFTATIAFSSPGTYIIRFQADPDDQVNEASEVNNFGEITVTITGAPASGN
jgi:hypothetical protein